MRFNLLCFLFLLFFPLHSKANAAVVINEIFPKSNREWIELYNNGSESIVLDRWTLQNNTGDKKIFYFNASSVIPPNSFLTVFSEQTGLTLHDEGDIVKLSDMNNNQIDSQGYFSTLGFNVSMGRSIDGAGTWTICTVATQNTANNCPAPSPLPTEIPTPIPTVTVAPTQLPTATETPVPMPTSIPEVLAATILPTNPIKPTVDGAPTPPLSEFKGSDRLRSIGWVVFLLGMVWGVIILIAALHHKIKSS
jgi:hypothetical protein